MLEKEEPPERKIIPFPKPYRGPKKKKRCNGQAMIKLKLMFCLLLEVIEILNRD